MWWCGCATYGIPPPLCLAIPIATDHMLSSPYPIPHACPPPASCSWLSPPIALVGPLSAAWKHKASPGDCTAKKAHLQAKHQAEAEAQGLGHELAPLYLSQAAAHSSHQALKVPGLTEWSLTAWRSSTGIDGTHVCFLPLPQTLTLLPSSTPMAIIDVMIVWCQITPHLHPRLTAASEAVAPLFDIIWAQRL